MNWTEFFDMGGYAFYVWWSYGITLVVLLLNIVLPLRKRSQVVARVKRALRRQERAPGHVKQGHVKQSQS